jgi:hypothetical protein
VQSRQERRRQKNSNHAKNEQRRLERRVAKRFPPQMKINPWEAGDWFEIINNVFASTPTSIEDYAVKMQIIANHTGYVVDAKFKAEVEFSRRRLGASSVKSFLSTSE